MTAENLLLADAMNVESAATMRMTAGTKAAAVAPAAGGAASQGRVAETATGNVQAPGTGPDPETGPGQGPGPGPSATQDQQSPRIRSTLLILIGTLA